MKDIKFYKMSEPYGYFSNFAPYPIFLDGEIWNTVEHYFQCNKFEDDILKAKIKKIESPMKVALEGRDTKYHIRSDWDSVKEMFMFNALRAKFFQHPELRIKLIETGDSKLIEHTSNDSYWGDGGDGNGKNRLGELLMKLRNDIITISSDTNIIMPPWIAFPQTSQYDMFWQMGLGADYIEEWSIFYLKLNDKLDYQAKFLPVSDWIDIYD